MTADTPPFEKTTRPNGLRIVTASMPHTRSASLNLFVGAGSRYESDDVAGVSHFLEHMLFKGAERHPTAKDLSEAIEGVGGVLNAGTDRELTVYWCKIARPHLRRAWDVLVDMYLHSRFDPDELEKERQVVIEEIRMYRDSPQQQVDSLIDELLWPKQALGRDIAGSEKSVAGLSREAMLDYVQRQYSPSNTVVSIAGNVEHGEIVELVEATLGDWSAGTPGPIYPARNGQKAPRSRFGYKKTEQAHLCLAVHGLPMLHPDRYALSLLDVVLGQGMSSRLFLQVREERGLAYDVHSFAPNFQDTGAFIVYAGVDPGKLEGTLDAILGELKRLCDEPVPAAELTKAKEYNKGRLLLRWEDTRSVSDSIGAQELLLGQIQSPDEIVEQIDQVTVEDVQRVARDLFQTAHLNLAVVGPYRGKEGQALKDRCLARLSV